MTKMMKKSAGWLLAAILAAGMTSCGGQDAGSSGADASAESSAGTSSEPISAAAETGSSENGLPIVDEPLTLTYAMEFSTYASANMNDYNEMAAYQELEKRTGIHIEFELISSAAKNEQFTLMMASQQLPDMIHWVWSSYPGGAQKAMDDGQIIPLTDKIADYAPNLSKILSENESIVPLISTADQEIYCFPYLSLDNSLNVYGGPIIRKDWLDKVNLPVPETIEEWHTALTAFKNEDVNGNGDKDDELPLLPTLGINATTGAGLFPYQAFVSAYGIELGFYQDDGVVKNGFYEPAYLDFLTEMNRWYNEGLIDPDFAATDSTLFEAKASGDLVGSCIGFASGTIGKYNTILQNNNPDALYVGAPYPVLNKGDVSESGQYRFPFSDTGTVITNACEHVEEACRWLDYQYSEEGNRLMYWGVEGVSYNMIDGKPRFIDSILSGERGFSIDVAQYSMASIGGPFVQDPEGVAQSNENTPVVYDAGITWTLPEYPHIIPPLDFTAEESDRNASIMMDTNKYINQMLAKFIMGVEPLDRFDAYLEELKSYGMEESIQIYQDALDRYGS